MDSLQKPPVVQTFAVVFDISLNELLNKQISCRWFETAG